MFLTNYYAVKLLSVIFCISLGFKASSYSEYRLPVPDGDLVRTAWSRIDIHLHYQHCGRVNHV